MGFPRIMGYHFRDPYKKDYSILGVYSGVAPFLETTVLCNSSKGLKLGLKLGNSLGWALAH